MKRPRIRTQIATLAAAGLVGAGLTVFVTGADAATTTYEAESATITAGLVESNHAGFTGSGFVNTDNAVGSAVQWSPQAVAGNATLRFRFANGTAVNRPMRITVNGTVVNAALAFNGTGAWTTWQETTVTTTLRAGANTILATSTTANGGPNLDRLTVVAKVPVGDMPNGISFSPVPVPSRPDVELTMPPAQGDGGGHGH